MLHLITCHGRIIARLTEVLFIDSYRENDSDVFSAETTGPNFTWSLNGGTKGCSPHLGQ